MNDDGKKKCIFMPDNTNIIFSIFFSSSFMALIYNLLFTCDLYPDLHDKGAQIGIFWYYNMYVHHIYVVLYGK